jgi:hypothetical protein
MNCLATPRGKPADPHSGPVAHRVTVVAHCVLGRRLDRYPGTKLSQRAVPGKIASGPCTLDHPESPRLVPALRITRISRLEPGP